MKIFLQKIPYQGVIIDVGGCWGWHWRKINEFRPDVTIFIVDLVRQNFVHAKNLLGELINKNIYLVHGNGTVLVFNDSTFDGYWSVQTLQHIPNFNKTVQEAHRVLKSGGVFASYSLNIQMPVVCLYNLLGKPYHYEGPINGIYYLARASKKQLEAVRSIFGNRASVRYTEILFQPELKTHYFGRENSLFGKVDACLSASSPLFSLIARQSSYHTLKR